MANNSGLKTQYVPTLSRILSTHINNAQTFASKATAERAKYEYNNMYAVGGADSQSGWVDHTQAGFTSPPTADVLGGLKVRPFSSYLLVSPGVLGSLVTTASYSSALDSDYMLVDSAGVQDATVLPFVANPSGSARVDVVECQVIDVVTNVSVDVIDPVTELFSSSLQPDVKQAGLSFRIRQGTAGSGYPGHQQGWLPLAIIIHPSGSTNFSNTDIYDVRPLTAMRASSHARVHLSREYMSGHQHTYQRTLTGTLRGTFDIKANAAPMYPSSGVGPYRMVGRLCNTRPDNTKPVEADGYTPGNLDYVPGSTTTAAHRWIYVLAFEPHGLPRWSRYSTAPDPVTGEREPGSNWGLYAITHDHNAAIYDHGKVDTYNLPTSYGITGAHRATVVAMYAQHPGVPSYLSLTPRRNGYMESEGSLMYVNGGGLPTATTSSGAEKFIDISGAVPRYCSGIRFYLTLEYVCSAAISSARIDVNLYDETTLTDISNIQAFTAGATPSGNVSLFAAPMEFSIPTTLFTGSAIPDYRLRINITIVLTGGGSASFTLNASSVSMFGFYIGY